MGDRSHVPGGDETRLSMVSERIASLRVAVIADDLTGAADAGVQLANTGHRTAVAFWDGPLAPASELDAVAVDTASRGLAAAEAGARVAAAAEALQRAPIVLKKVDSTLRGPIAAEVRAAMRASGRTRMVVAPAFPVTGRATRGGVQHAGGRPLADVREVLGCEDAAVLSRGEAAEPARIAAALRAHECVVADAEADGDLVALVRAVPDAGAVLWVGSAGLAAALGAVHPGARRGPRQAPPAQDAVLAVIGSASPVAREQVRRLAAAPGVAEVPLSLDLLAGGRAEEAVRTAAAAARDALGASRCAVVHVPAPEPHADGVAQLIVRALARVAAGLVAGRLVLSGGETAIHVLRAVGARGLLLECELEPGVVLSGVIGPRPCRVVSKAGGFGGPLTLVRAVEALGGRVGDPP